MNILHVIPSVGLEDGGPSYAVRQMERALCARGHKVTTISTGEPAKYDNDGALGVPCHQGYATRLYFRRQSERYKISAGLARWGFKNIPTFDIVHTHALFSFAPVWAGFSAHHLKVPFLVRPLGVL